MRINRRTFVLGAAAAAIAAPSVARAAEPEFRLKFGNIVSGDHPLNTAMAKDGERIKTETDGRVAIGLFPKNQLGSDADMLSQPSANGFGVGGPSHTATSSRMASSL